MRSSYRFDLTNVPIYSSCFQTVCSMLGPIRKITLLIVGHIKIVPKKCILVDLFSEMLVIFILFIWRHRNDLPYISVDLKNYSPYSIYSRLILEIFLFNSSDIAKIRIRKQLSDISINTRVNLHYMGELNTWAIWEIFLSEIFPCTNPMSHTFHCSRVPFRERSRDLNLYLILPIILSAKISLQNFIRY